MPGVFHTITLEEIASWPAPNYEDPVERKWLPAFALIWYALATIFAAIRIYSRSRRLCGSFGSDDIAIIIAWIFSTGFTISTCVSVWRFDVGRHVWDVRPQNYVPALKNGWAIQVLFLCSTGATKASVYLLYLRLFNSTYHKRWIWATWTLFAVTFLSWLGILLSYFFMCTPLSTFWNVQALVAEGHENFTCARGDPMIVFFAIFTTGSDFWTAALPCVILKYYDLGVTAKQRLILQVVFCLSFLVAGAGVVRSVYLWQIKYDMDTSWVGYNLVAAATVECQLAIMCCCVPFLRGLYRVYFAGSRRESVVRLVEEKTVITKSEFV